MATGAKGLVAHGGARPLCDPADGVGLAEELPVAIAPAKRPRRGHDRGEMLVGLAVADGVTSISDLRVLSEQAAPTCTRGFGFYPLLAHLDATSERTAGLLRPGNAGPETAADHVAVLDQPLFQLPVDPKMTEAIVRTDAASRSHASLEACTRRKVRFTCLGVRACGDVGAVRVCGGRPDGQAEAVAFCVADPFGADLLEGVELNLDPRARPLSGRHLAKRP